MSKPSHTDLTCPKIKIISNIRLDVVGAFEPSPKRPKMEGTQPPLPEELPVTLDDIPVPPPPLPSKPIAPEFIPKLPKPYSIINEALNILSHSQKNQQGIVCATETKSSEMVPVVKPITNKVLENESEATITTTQKNIQETVHPTQEKASKTMPVFQNTNFSKDAVLGANTKPETIISTSQKNLQETVCATKTKSSETVSVFQSYKPLKNEVLGANTKSENIISTSQKNMQQAVHTTQEKAIEKVQNTNFIKKEVFSANKKPETITSTSQNNMQEIVPATDAKPLSWASNYLKSIGLVYPKPIKINLSSSLKKSNAAPAEIDISESAAEEKNERKISDKIKCLSNQSDNSVPIDNSKPIEKVVLTSRSESPELRNDNDNLPDSKICLQPCLDNNHPKTFQIANENAPVIEKENRDISNSKTISQSHFDNNNTETFKKSNGNSPVLDNYNKNFSNTKICLQPYITTNNSENFQITYDDPSYSNFHTYYHKEPYAIDRNRRVDNRFLEDKTYLDKVEEFLAKISQYQNTPHNNDYHKIKFENYTQSRKRSHSREHRDIDNVCYEEKQQKMKTVKNIYVEVPKARDFDMNKYNKVKERPSTSKQHQNNCRERIREHNYHAPSKTKTKNIKLEEKYNTRQNKERINSRHEYFRERSPHDAHNINKTRQRSVSCSSSEHFRCRSPYYIDKYQKNIKRKKRQRSVSSSSSEDFEDNLHRHMHKNTRKINRTRRETRESSNSNSYSEKLEEKSFEHICNAQQNKRYKVKRERSNSSSNSDKVPDKFPHQNIKTQNIKTGKIRGENREQSKSSCKSEKVRNISPTYGKKAKENKKNKIKKELSSSSSHSDNCKDSPPRHSHKTQENEKYKTRKVKDNTNESRNIKKKLKEKYDICNKSCSFIKNSHKCSDGKNTCKVIKNIISKDKIKKTIIKSLISCNSKTSKYSNHKETDSKRKNNENLEHKANVVENTLNQKQIPIKSIVQMKDKNQRKMRDNSHEMENFDLRSKISRRNLNQHFTSICNKTKQMEKEIEKERENLVITVENQDQEEAIKTEKKSEIKICEKKIENAKAKKYKKIKLIINVVCNSSDDEYDPVVEKLNKESIIDGTEELSFLDDLNIDEIVDSLTSNINELNVVSKNNNDTMNENVTIELTDSEHSDASTIHLEEFVELNSDVNDAKESEEDLIRRKENESRDTENNSITQTRRVTTLNNTENGTENVKPETVQSKNHQVIIESEIKEEIIDCENNSALLIDTDKSINQNTKAASDKSYVVPVEEVHKNTHIQDHILSMHEIKEEPVNELQDIENKKLENDNKDTENNFVVDKEKGVEKDTHTENNIISVGNIKLETPDEEIKIPKIKDVEQEPTDDYEINKKGDKKKYTQNIIIPVDIKEELIDEEMKTLENKEIKEEQLSNTEVNEKTLENKHTQDIIISVDEIKEEPTDNEIKMVNKHELFSANRTKARSNERGEKETVEDTTNRNMITMNSKNHSTYKPNDYKQVEIKIETQDFVPNTILQDKSENEICDGVKETKVPQLNKSTEIIAKPNEAFVQNAITKYSTIDLCNEDVKILNDRKIVEPIAKTNEAVAQNVVIKYDIVDLTNDLDITDKNVNTNKEEHIVKSKTTCDKTINAPVETSSEMINSVIKNTETGIIKEKGSNCAIPNKTLSSLNNRESEITVTTVQTSIKSENPSPGSITKKLNDDNISKTLKCTQNKNRDDNGSSKLKKEQDLSKNGQQSKFRDTEKKTAPIKQNEVKSRSHSPIRVKSESIETKHRKKSPLLNKPYIDKSFIEKIEKVLINYFHEPYSVNFQIHNGKFSKIFHCRNRKGQNYVVKILKPETDHYSRDLVSEQVMASLQRDIPKENLNFVRLFDSLPIAGLRCFLMDYYPKNLSELCNENGKSLHINVVQNLSRQLVAAVMVLRHYNVVHSDIRPGHLMVNSSNDKLKLCGFDSAYYINQIDVRPNIGSVNYRAPEIILGHSAGYSIDVWSTALVMYEMATRRHLFPGFINNDILFKQICTMGYIPSDMIQHSRFAYKHFFGGKFKRYFRCGKGHTLLSDREVYKNNVLNETVVSTYFSEWSKGISSRQRMEERAKVDGFCSLLQEMLVIDPTKRLPIEFVYANPFLLDVRTR